MEKQINLAPQGQLETSVWGKVLNWSVSVGRFIVVFTELIVISAFLSRFFLDKRLSDLNQAIEQKVAIIASASDFETRFRQAQNRLAATKAIAAAQVPTQAFLADLESLLPSSVYLTQTNLKDHELTIKGTALSETGLAQFIALLKSHPHLTQVNLNQLSLQTQQTGIEFNVSATWQPQTATAN